MTKIKNTKKGMAKKTLSMSLVVAMLATSNVPVWAAEFSDGSDVAVTAETPAAETETTEGFSDDSAQAFSNVETPAVEETENVAEATKASAKDTLALSENGWANDITVTGKVYNSDGSQMTSYLYAWEVDGKIGNHPGVDFGYVQDANNIAAESGANYYRPSASDIGKKVVYKVFNYTGQMPSSPEFAGDKDNYVTETAPVTVSKTDIKSGTVSYDQNKVLTYNGKKQSLDLNSLNLKVTFPTGVTLSLDDFYAECDLIEGDGIDADSVYRIKATPRDQSLYTNVLRLDYKIAEKDYKAGDISATYATTPKTYEYTGELIVPEAKDLKLYDEVGGRHKELVSEDVVDEITVDGPSSQISAVGQTYTTRVNVENVPNFTESSLANDEKIEVKGGYKVVARNLANCDITVDTISFTGSAIKALNDSRFRDKIHIFDKTTGEELSLNSYFDNQYLYDYDIIVKELPVEGTRKYQMTIQAPTGSGASGNTTGSKTIEFTLGDHTFEDAGFALDSSVENALEAPVAYTGKTAVKDTSKVVFKKADGTELSKQDYKITVEGVDAGKKKGKVVITGLRSYEGYEQVYYFDIEKAFVDADDVAAAAKVAFNKGYTKASQYAPKVTVKACTAKNTNGTWASSNDKAFTLTKDDFKVSYSFKSYNGIGQKIVCRVKITNKNFQGGQTSFVVDNTVISRKQLSNCTVTVEPGSYTYTGATVVPTLKVMDGTEVLTEGVDYEIAKLDKAVDVGTATVIIKGVDKNKADDGMPKDGIYDPDSTASATFEITPAKAEDVEVGFVGGNTGIKYTGKNLKPTVAYVTLNGNDVSKQFDISYPSTNINVGKGHVTLTPVSGNKNFTGTKDAEFDITARELKGTLKVYDENNIQYAVDTDGTLYTLDAYGNHVPVSFAFDGTAHTFKSAEFVPSGDYAKYVTADDYEIKYANNTYGETAYIYVEGKGNFKGTDTITDADGDVIKSVVTKNRFIVENYEIKKQHVTISDGEYAAGQPVRPNVKVVVGGKELVENQDYVLRYTAVSDLTKGQTHKVVIEGINGYKGIIEGYWGVVQRNMANTQVVLNKSTYKKNETPSVTVYNSGKVVPASEYTVKYADDSLTVTASKDSKYYTGSQTVKVIRENEASIGAPVITNVRVTGNKATVILGGEAANASGYDYVISTDRDCIVNKDYDSISKNQVSTSTTFKYVGQRTYYAYCHAWTRDENGKKVFGEWSNAYPFSVTAITPDTPVITNVEVSGSTIKVTYKAAANATGYDVVLGTDSKKENGETRPYHYGNYKKLNLKEGTVTATFKNVPKGTWVVGMHAFNRTSEDGKKVFSPWSNLKKATVK